MDRILTVKTRKGEITIEDFCSMEYKRILLLMKLVEEEFDVNLRDYKQMRKQFLNVADFIKNMPNIICEVHEIGCKDRMDD